MLTQTHHSLTTSSELPCKDASHITSMSEQHAKTWLGKLTKLNPNIAKAGSALRGKAPHKPLLLLCLLDMAEAGELTSRTFARSASLVLRFRSYGTIIADRWS